MLPPAWVARPAPATFLHSASGSALALALAADRGRRHALLVPVAVALYAVVACALAQASRWPALSDWPVFYTAARALLLGGDPYAAVDALPSHFPFYYPLPAAMVLAPLGALPIRIAWLAFAALAGTLLALAGQRYGRGLLVACLSAPFLEAVAYGHPTPLLVAAAVLPVLAPLLVIKPNIGAALWVFRPNLAAVTGGLALLLLSLAIMPGWPVSWYHSLRHTNHVAPLLRPGGFLLLAAAYRWRTPEARLLLALTCIPQTSDLYESLPLFLIPQSRVGGYVLAVGGFLEAILANWLVPLPGLSVERAISSRWPLLLICLYLPALVMVLRSNRSAAADASK